MISAMRRLGRAFLRAPWGRRLAALTVMLGLLAGNSALLASTVFAATPSTWPGLQGNGLLGLLSNTVHSDTDTDRVTLPQSVCQLAPVFCQPGTKVFTIHSGVLTLGAAPQAPRHTSRLVTLPHTGSCLLGVIGSCSTPSPTPNPAAKATAAVATSPATPSPSSTSTTTTSTTTSTSTAGASSCGLLSALLAPACSSGGAPVSATCSPSPGTSACTATPAPDPNALCLLSCGLLQLGGSGPCAAQLLSSCLLGSAAPTTPPAAGSSPGICVATVCLLGSSCTASVGTGCLLGAILPALPSGGSQTQPSNPGGSQTGGSVPAGAVVGGGTRAGSTPTTGGPGFLGGIGTIGSPQSGAGGSTGGIGQLPPQKSEETVGLVSGLTFGHGLILWPLFGLLDLAALAGLVVVVRRRWTASTS